MSSGIDAVLFLCVTLILGAEVDSLQFGSGARDRTHFGIEQPVALVFSYKANVTDSNET